MEVRSWQQRWRGNHQGKEVKDPRGQGSPTEIIQVDIKVTKTDDKRRDGRQVVNQELKSFWNEGE